MNKYYILIMLFFLLISCKRTSIEESKTNGLVEVMPNSNIKPILDSIVNSDTLGYSFNEIYVHKGFASCINEIIIYRGRYSAVKNKDIRPVCHTKIQEIDFSIYSGIESYFQNSDTEKVIPSNKPDEIDIEYDVVFYIMDSCGFITTKNLGIRANLFKPSLDY